MIEANAINSTFYALRLLSHRLDTSEIEVTDGEEYPASEFTREEQEQALKTIRQIEDSESTSLDQLPPDKIDFYVKAFADRIEELANGDLATAGYTPELPRAPVFQRPHLSPSAEQLELTPRQIEVLYLIAEGHSLEDIAQTLGISVNTVKAHQVKLMLRLSIRRRLPGRTEPEDQPSTQRS